MRLNQLLLLLAGLLLIVPSCEGRAHWQVPHKKTRHVGQVRATDAHVDELRARNLLLPVQGTDPESWKNSFYSARGGGKFHYAVDMRAPMRTPIRAVDNGNIARMNTGKRGGISIYQTDPARRFNYYYCHLHSYASGLKTGSKVKRGQIIGYVGSTGHSSGPHLHFQISKITNPAKLWAGLPINPYHIFGTGTSRTGTSVASNAEAEPSSHIAMSRASKSQFSRAKRSQISIRKVAALSRKRGSKSASGRHLVASARKNARGAPGSAGLRALASVPSSRVARNQSVYRSASIRPAARIAVSAQPNRTKSEPS
ncbi:MAG: M23 family metallopeptidase [Candidatus Obscuribacterales bacterium]|nr:M23 family metallopeptidase [Candidatus Obscuribacterales bacterium]